MVADLTFARNTAIRATSRFLLRLVLPKASLAVAPYGVVLSVFPELQPLFPDTGRNSRGGELQSSAIRHPTFLVCHVKLADLAISIARTAELEPSGVPLGPGVISDLKKCDAIDSPLVFEVTCICPLL